ncbi:diacylglycerol kinase family protein [Croceibacterium sp. TMG7-5b_MA50]|uniref:diacylglycerol kinase family protein n=1 Tax=Croceibacterium sp. TMG7-5b_MA50 TaxID=3121290 RepID=UPI0032216CA4
MMTEPRPLWLVNNASSGSNDDDGLEALHRCCGTHGFRVAQRTTFPAEDLPTPAVLDAAGIDLVAVFAGDGTINTLVTSLAGWGGQVLVLPGGTMNLLFHRLHGEAEMDAVIERVAAGDYSCRRPGMARSPAGDAFAGVLAGPGTSWNQVREAMRDIAVLDVATGVAAALGETVSGDMIACTDPALGRPEGYPLLMLTPTDEGLQVDAYHAEGVGEYLQQGWALMRRNFRDGPHDRLGMVDQVTFASVAGTAFGMLIDGEPSDPAPQATFSLARAEVDLIATAT